MVHIRETAWRDALTPGRQRIIRNFSSELLRIVQPLDLGPIGTQRTVVEDATALNVVHYVVMHSAIR